LKAARIIARIYVLICLGSLALFAIGTFGWFGVEPDPISAAFAILAAMPWSLAFSALYSPAVTLAGLLAAMLLNVLLILAIGRVLSRVHRNS
jgi:hypothetical protein